MSDRVIEQLPTLTTGTGPGTSGPGPRDRRAERFAATRKEILEAAWELVRAEGLASLSMRDLGARVGMRAQSLYAYFASKHAIYDAMFAEANGEFLRGIEQRSAGRDPVAVLKRQTHYFLQFCVEDPVRYQLLFQRTLPGFVPSAEAYAPAVQVLAHARTALGACGVRSPRALDLWTALTGGLAAQQNANEPSGDRWTRLADEATDMFLTHCKTKGGRR